VIAALQHIAIQDDLWVLLPAWTTVAFLAIAALFAGRQLKEATALREAQIRPYMTIGLETPAPHLIYLVIENLGNSIAEGVTFKCEPAISSTLEDENPTRVADFLARPRPTVVPRSRVETLLDVSHQRLNSDLPLRYDIVVSYTAPAWRGKRYCDKFVLDIEGFKGRRFSSRKDAHDIANALEALGSTLSNWIDND
jgi:hypothetical protein